MIMFGLWAEMSNPLTIKNTRDKIKSGTVKPQCVATGQVSAPLLD